MAKDISTTTAQTGEISATAPASGTVPVSNTASVPAVGSAPVVKSETYQVVVKAPADKGMLAYLVGPGAEIILQGIDLNKSTLTEEGGNLRITTAKGGEILLLDYVNSAHDPKTMIVTEDGRLPAQKLLVAIEAAEQHADATNAQVQPAAGPQGGQGGEGGGIEVPAILGTGVGEGSGIFSSVIGPYALPIWTDAIKTEQHPNLDRAPGTPGNPPVGPGNLPPFAHDDTFSTAINKPLTVTPGQLLANDTDPENDTLSIISVQDPHHGTVAIDGNGNVVFTPDHDFTGTGSYSYTITDGHGGTSTAEVVIQIDPTFPGQNTVIAADDAYLIPVAGDSKVLNVLINDSDPQGDAILPGSVRILVGPSVGTATANADGTITYHSVPSNTDYFTTLVYEIHDARGAADTATVTIEVKANINSVDAVDDTGEIMPAGAAKVFTVTANDFDPQGDAFHITGIVSGPAQGTATFDPATGTITYQSVPGADYIEHITYQITDSKGATDTAVLTINVAVANNVNAVDDTADMVAGRDVNIKVLANDFDQQGDSFHLTAITQQPIDENGHARGTVTINADGTITFTDTAGARDSGEVNFRYSITDSHGAVDEAVVRVTITPGINGVDANNDTLTVAQNAPRADITATILANDFDPQGDTFSITAITPASHGTVELVGGHVFFTPEANYNGPSIFTYTITDSKGAQDTAQVLVNVQEGPHTTLNAGDDNYSTPFNTNITITAAQTLSNDYDPDGSVLTGASITGFTQPAHGVVTKDANGNFTYNPEDTFHGTDSFTYTITDGQGDTDTAVITIRVGDPNSQDNPVDAVDDTVHLHPGETKTVNVVTNDSAPDGGLAFDHVIGVLPAGVTDHGNGVFSYSAPFNQTGQTVSFQYVARDVDGDTDTATVTFIVDGPVNSVDAIDDSVTLVRNAAPVAVDTIVINELANDFDPQGDPFHATRIVSGPAIGSAVLNADGTITYTADAAQRGTYDTTLVYEIEDSHGAKDTATITIHVGADFNSVDAVDDSVTLVRNTANNAVDSIVINELANDSDPQGDAFHATRIVTGPAIGTAVLNADGTITYTADPATTGAYDTTIVYEIEDSKGAKDTATITVHVGADFNNVDARDDSATTPFQTPVTINVLANDVDPQGDTFSITAHTNPSHGTVVQNNDGTFTYTPANGFTGSDSFTYTITDSKGATDTATVTITTAEKPFNDVDARDDSATTPFNTPVTINVLANDVDAQGDAFSITGHTNPLNGSVVQNANGTFTYTPNAGFQGNDSFTYTITDSKGATDTATVHVTTQAQPNTVDARDDNASTAFQTPVNINVLSNDVDPQGDAFSITGHTNPAHGTVVQNANGTFTYTPSNGFSGNDSFTYTITDARGATDTATVTVTTAPQPFNNVIAQNDAAVVDIPAFIDIGSGFVYSGGGISSELAGSIYNYYYGGVRIDQVATNVLANDFDPQGDSFHITAILQQPHFGNAIVQADGTIIYQISNASDIRGLIAAGSDTIVYQITDSKGATAQATYTIYPGTHNPPTPGDADDGGGEGGGGGGGEGGGGGGEGGGGGGGDPLVIDLDRNGIALSTLAESNAHFNLHADIDPNATAEHTAWFSGNDDGILAMDRNGNGTIDNVTEVFGGSNTDGFTALRALDSNHDNVIDAKDAQFADLKVWIDSNHDGISQAGELHTLHDVGVASINLQNLGTHISYQDGHISNMGAVTMEDGSTTGAYSVVFTNDGTGIEKGTNANDIMIYSKDATMIDGSLGTNYLRVEASESGENIDVGHNVNLHGIEVIDMKNQASDKLSINVDDILHITDQHVIAVHGDAVDQVNITGDFTQGANVEQAGTSYSSYTSSNGAQLLVELGVQVHADPVHHG